MRLFAGLLLLVALAGCADSKKIFPLEPYEPWRKERTR